MLCPVCKTVELKMAERQGIEIDYCPQCRGVWLDRGELDKIIERSGEYPSVPQAAPPPPPPPSTPGYPPPQPGYPPQTPPGAYPPSPYGGGYRRDDDSDYKQGYGHGSHQHYPKKRKSMLGELFDFD